MKTTRSIRYRKIADKISSDKNFLPKEAIEFIIENTLEKSKKIKASFLLKLDKKTNKTFLSNKETVPNINLSFPKKKVLVILAKDNNVFVDRYKSKGVVVVFGEEFERSFTSDGKISKKKIKLFSKIICHPEEEKFIKIFEKKILPLGIYPNKKKGTLTEDIENEINKISEKELDIKFDKCGSVNTFLGDVDLGVDKLVDNFNKIQKFIFNLKPSNWKGKYFKKIFLSSSMGPSLSINV